LAFYVRSQPTDEAGKYITEKGEIDEKKKKERLEVFRFKIFALALFRGRSCHRLVDGLLPLVNRSLNSNIKKGEKR